MNNTYWDGNGKYQHLYKQLLRLMPDEGKVSFPKKNKALERLRKASNCYYDLFNNGLCNRSREFYQVFGFGGMSIVKNNFAYSELLEKTMDGIIIEAVKEQQRFFMITIRKKGG